MRTWLVIEDEPDLYDMVLAMYSTLGVDGLSFTTGEEATEWIEEVENGKFKGELPEFGLLDIRLPGEIDGVMVGERLRGSPTMKNMVIVLMTAFKLSRKEEKEALSRTGANLLLYKPLPKLTDFDKMVHNLLKGRRRRNGHSA